MRRGSRPGSRPAGSWELDGDGGGGRGQAGKDMGAGACFLSGTLCGRGSRRWVDDGHLLARKSLTHPNLRLPASPGPLSAGTEDDFQVLVFSQDPILPSLLAELTSGLG